MGRRARILRCTGCGQVYQDKPPWVKSCDYCNRQTEYDVSDREICEDCNGTGAASGARDTLDPCETCDGQGEVHAVQD